MKRVLKINMCIVPEIKTVIDQRVETRWPNWNKVFNTNVLIWFSIVTEEIDLEWQAPDDPDGYNEYEVDILRENQWGEVVLDYTFTFRSYVNYFADPDPTDITHWNDASGDGISDADTYRLSSDPLIDGRAHPLRKDLFVEVDWMEGHRMMDAAKWMVGTRFLNNPTGEEIWLHIDDGKMGGGEQIPHYDDSTYFGVRDGDMNDFYDYKEKHFDSSRDSTFHYCIFAQNAFSPVTGKNHLGIANMPGNNFIVGAGNWKFGLVEDKQTAQAGVFMHELGHNLNLDHYTDWLNPNPKTCMNYHWILLFVDYTSDEWDNIELDVW